MRTNMICQPGPWMGRRRFAPPRGGRACPDDSLGGHSRMGG